MPFRTLDKVREHLLVQESHVAQVELRSLVRVEKPQEVREERPQELLEERVVAQDSPSSLPRDIVVPPWDPAQGAARDSRADDAETPRAPPAKR